VVSVKRGVEPSMPGFGSGASQRAFNWVSSWAATAGVPVADASKKDRCAKIVGDIVAKAVVLMNDRFLSSLTPAAWSPPASYATCYTCHTKPDLEPSQQGKMECQACHTVARGHGSWKRNRNGRR